jgi:hypothetical protein
MFAPAIAGVATPMPAMPAAVHGYGVLAPTRYMAPGKRLIRF